MEQLTEIFEQMGVITLSSTKEDELLTMMENATLNCKEENFQELEKAILEERSIFYLEFDETLTTQFINKTNKRYKRYLSFIPLQDNDELNNKIKTMIKFYMKCNNPLDKITIAYDIDTYLFKFM